MLTNMVNMVNVTPPTDSGRKAEILDAAIDVFGRFGFKKTSVDDLAKAAKLSKQGLYLHFTSKEEIFTAAIRKYLSDGLRRVEQELSDKNATLRDRLAGAMDAWFGRRIETFDRTALDVIDAADHLSPAEINEYKAAFRSKIASALATDAEFKNLQTACSSNEIAEVLFRFGLTWKEPNTTRQEFLRIVRLCVETCCQLKKTKKGKS
jgi:TetR/AcrR family transcriptional regulator, regulator of autoinduction and epiphytic fitness